jgi:hypothetical protein
MQKAYEARAQAAHRQNKGKAPVLGNGQQRPAIRGGDGEGSGGNGPEDGEVVVDANPGDGENPDVTMS